jgi:hypothetical protein
MAVTVHFENVDIVVQPVEQGTGPAFGAEGASPLVEGQFARN